MRNKNDLRKKVWEEIAKGKENKTETNKNGEQVYMK